MEAVAETGTQPPVWSRDRHRDRRLECADVSVHRTCCDTLAGNDGIHVLRHALLWRHRLLRAELGLPAMDSVSADALHFGWRSCCHRAHGDSVFTPTGHD